MIGRMLAALVALLISIGAAAAQCGAYPNTLVNGQPADANQVMANFNFILNCVNNIAAPRGHLAGLTMSNDASPSKNINTTAGVAVSDDAAPALMQMTSGFAKNANLAWTVGNANGCLDTGSLAVNTWYHLFVIKRTDTNVVDELCSQSATSPVMPASFTKKRRIGSFRTDGSGNVLPFIQNGDMFEWATVKGDVSAPGAGASAVLRTLTVPTGVSVEALLNVRLTVTNGDAVYLSDPAQTDEVVGTFAVTHNASTPGSYPAVQARARTNTSAQIRSRQFSGGSGETLFIGTWGWIDRRGRDN